MLSLRSRTLRLVHSPRLQLLMPVPVACRQRGVMTPITMQPQRSYNGSNHLSAIAKQTQPQPRPAATDASDRSPAASTSDVGLPQREEEIPQKEEQPGPFEWFSKHLVTVGVSVLSVLIAIQSVQSSGMITSVHKDELVLNSSEAANKHRPHLVRLVEERLKVPYKVRICTLPCDAVACVLRQLVVYSFFCSALLFFSCADGTRPRGRHSRTQVRAARRSAHRGAAPHNVVAGRTHAAGGTKWMR
jgi:hypothetical protein